MLPVLKVGCGLLFTSECKTDSTKSNHFVRHFDPFMPGPDPDFGLLGGGGGAQPSMRAQDTN